MLTERLNTRNYSFFEKLKSLDYFLILIIMLLGAISVFAIYSTEKWGVFFLYKKPFNKIDCIFYDVLSFVICKNNFLV